MKAVAPGGCRGESGAKERGEGRLLYFSYGGNFLVCGRRWVSLLPTLFLDVFFRFLRLRLFFVLNVGRCSRVCAHQLYHPACINRDEAFFLDGVAGTVVSLPACCQLLICYNYTIWFQFVI